MPGKKSLSVFRCYSPNDPLCSCSSSAAVWPLSSQGLGKKCSWFNQSSVTNLQLCMILEFLLLGSSLYLVQASVVSSRGQRPHADSRDWWPGRQDSAHHLPSSSGNFMPIKTPSENDTDFLWSALQNVPVRHRWWQGNTEQVGVLGAMHWSFVCSGVPFTRTHTHTELWGC